jgi:hypothetical protein
VWEFYTVGWALDSPNLKHVYVHMSFIDIWYIPVNFTIYICFVISMSWLRLFRIQYSFVSYGKNGVHHRPSGEQPNTTRSEGNGIGERILRRSWFVPTLPHFYRRAIQAAEYWGRHMQQNNHTPTARAWRELWSCFRLMIDAQPENPLRFPSRGNTKL